MEAMESALSTVPPPGERFGERMFTCPKEGCGRSYSKYAWWRRHVLECCYSCRCGKMFESKLHLLLHAATEHDHPDDNRSGSSTDYSLEDERPMMLPSLASLDVPHRPSWL